MSEMISLYFPFPAVPKQRPRAGKGGHFYTPKKTAQFERRVADFFRNSRQKCIEEGCLSVSIVFNLPHVQKVVKEFKKKGNSEIQIIYRPVKPDLDNLTKSVLDALNKFAWGDDSQITSMQMLKFYNRLCPNGSISITAFKREKCDSTELILED